MLLSYTSRSHDLHAPSDLASLNSALIILLGVECGEDVITHS